MPPPAHSASAPTPSAPGTGPRSPALPVPEMTDPDMPARVHASFARQSAMALIRAQLTRVAPGEVWIEVPHWPGIHQQHGFVHGGVVGMVADSAAGYAAMSCCPADRSVLTVEYKINLMAPARGERIIARGSVLRGGRTLLITRADVVSVVDGEEQLCAVMQQTIMAVRAE